MIESCEKLKSIIDLTYFSGINAYEQAMLRQYVQENNLDLIFEEPVTDISLEDENFMNYKLKDKYPAYDNSKEWDVDTTGNVDWIEGWST